MAEFRFKILALNPELGIRAAGVKFVFFFIVVLFAAVNTGNNLTYLIFSTLCGFVVAGWTLAAVSMSALRIKLRLPQEIYAGEESRIDFFVSKGRSPLPGRSLAFSLHPLPSAEGAHDPYAARVSRGDSRRLVGLYMFSKRGRYRIEGVDVRCGYPFGLISLTRRHRQRHELLIYPKIMPLEELFERRGDGMALRDSRLRGQGGGLLSVRPFMPGDDYRRMHWKASAKLEQMMLKEFAQEEGQAIWLHFNPLRRDDPSKGDEELFELGVSAAASVAYHGRSLGLRMLLSAPGLRLAPDVHGANIRHFLDYLADIKLGPRMASPKPTGLPGRRGDEMALVIDPLNREIDWGDAHVLDRDHFSGLRRRALGAIEGRRLR